MFGEPPCHMMPETAANLVLRVPTLPKTLGERCRTLAQPRLNEIWQYGDEVRSKDGAKHSRVSSGKEKGRGPRSIKNRDYNESIYLTTAKDGRLNALYTMHSAKHLAQALTVPCKVSSSPGPELPCKAFSPQYLNYPAMYHLHQDVNYDPSHSLRGLHYQARFSPRGTRIPSCKCTNLPHM